VDGRKQRKALTAAESAVKALGRGDGVAAVRAAATATELDQIGAYSGLSRSVADAAGDLDAAGSVRKASWQVLADTVGPGPLSALIAEIAG